MLLNIFELFIRNLSPQAKRLIVIATGRFCNVWGRIC